MLLGFSSRPTLCCRTFELRFFPWRTTSLSLNQVLYFQYHLDRWLTAHHKTQAALALSNHYRFVVKYDLTFCPLYLLILKPCRTRRYSCLRRNPPTASLFKINADYPNLDEEISDFAFQTTSAKDVNQSMVKPVLNTSRWKYQGIACNVIIEDNSDKILTFKFVLECTRNNAILILGASPRASIATRSVQKDMPQDDFVTPDDIIHRQSFRYETIVLSVSQFRTRWRLHPDRAVYANLLETIDIPR
jgi:hypothetical protein